MANNPLAAPLQSLQSIGDGLTQSVQSIHASLASSLSQGLGSLASGLPALPGLPGGQAAGVLPKLPSIQSLAPANLTQALTSIENVAIPAGLPRVSSLLNPSPKPAPTDTTPPAQPSAIIQQPDGSKPANTAIQGRRRITQLGGY
jgi:hypothetical protein